MRERKWIVYFSWLSFALAFLMAGCFIEGGTVPTLPPEAAQAATAQATQEVIIDASPTPEGFLPTETPADLPLMPTETPIDVPLQPTEAMTVEVLPTTDFLLPTETPIESVFVPTETPFDVPLFPTETPFEVILATDVLVPTDDDALFVSSTPPVIVFDPTATVELFVPTATVEAFVPTTDPNGIFVSSTPPNIIFDVSATPQPIIPTQEIVPTQEIFPTFEDSGQGGGMDLVAMALATATAVTDRYNQSLTGGNAPSLPPVIAPLGVPTPVPPVVPVECLAPQFVSLSQVIGPPSLIVELKVLEPNPDYNYTWMALVDGRLNVVGSANGTVATLSFNQRGTYEMRLQVRLAPGRELTNADGTRHNCQQDFIIEQKINVVG